MSLHLPQVTAGFADAAEKRICGNGLTFLPHQDKKQCSLNQKLSGSQPYVFPFSPIWCFVGSQLSVMNMTSNEPLLVSVAERKQESTTTNVNICITVTGIPEHRKNTSCDPSGFHVVPSYLFSLGLSTLDKPPFVCTLHE